MLDLAHFLCETFLTICSIDVLFFILFIGVFVLSFFCCIDSKTNDFRSYFLNTFFSLFL